jgi:hypothetical protein
MVSEQRFVSVLLILFCCAVVIGVAAADSLLPSVKEIVERYDNALGGRDAIMRHTSSTVRGTTDVHMAAGNATLSCVLFLGAP